METTLVVSKLYHLFTLGTPATYVEGWFELSLMFYPSGGGLKNTRHTRFSHPKGDGVSRVVPINQEAFIRRVLAGIKKGSTIEGVQQGREGGTGTAMKQQATGGGGEGGG